VIGGGFFSELRDRLPACFAIFAQQSVQAQSKLVELIARRAGLVSREDFERQKQICERLQNRISELEEKLEALRGGSAEK
jgi:BMFP domain-containing protein YqiC